MKETGILFSAPMVRAILAGEKTQTRRVVKLGDFSPNDFGGATWVERDGLWHPCRDELCRGTLDPIGPGVRCPYGVPGDRLILLSSWAVAPEHDAVKPTELPHDVRVWSRWDGGEKPEWCGKLRPGRFLPTSMRHPMPRADVVNVRVERVQDISDEDVEAEGVTPEAVCALLKDPPLHKVLDWAPIELWRAGWIAINGAESWDANVWVWKIEFRRV